MASSKTRTFLLIAVPALILLLPLSIYFMDSAAASDKVARNVTIAGVDVARQTEDQAIQSVSEYTNTLTGRSATIVVKGTEFALDPSDVGLTFDSSRAVGQALELRKDGISDWIDAFRSEVDVTLAATLDEDLVNAKLLEWEQAAIPNPAFEGSITITNGIVTSEYPRSGEAIDRDAAFGLLLSALETGNDDPVELPVVQSNPVFTEKDIDDGVAQAKKIINRGVVLTNDEYGFEFRVPAPSLGRALVTEVIDGDTPTIQFSIDPVALGPLIEASRSTLEVEPVDARWETVLVDDFEGYDDQFEIKDSPEDDLTDEERALLPENDTIELIPSLNGTSVNPADVAAAVEEAALGDGTGELPLERNAEPAFTTEMAESFGELSEISEFTTYVPGFNRRHNIQLMADIVDQAIVMPGETFSVNEHVGRRTLEKGFKYDCAIVGGILSCEEDPVNVGGGVSQFGTTIFNAIYFGCLEDVTHAPHSIYFRKYPEGREATLGFPSPDVAFTNDTEAPVIIRTSYTDRSLTVTFFGNTGGITCGTERGSRTGFTSPQIVYMADEEGVVAPGEEVVEREGSGGWSIVNWRIFYDATGTEIEREKFPWTYRGERNVILMHPCEEKVGGSGECPATIPAVVGLSQGDASSALSGAGFVVNIGPAVSTPDQNLDGIVMSQDLEGFADAGTAITISVYEWDGTPPPDDG